MLNSHLLAAAEDVDLLDALLSRLRFSFRDVEYHASDSGLIALGRAFSNNLSLEDGVARIEGAKQFKVSVDDLKAQFQKDARFRERCLVGVAAGRDGTSGMQTSDGAFVAYREGLERFAHVIFTGNDKDREFWLGLGADDEETLNTKYGGLKLCIHGSDAHSAIKLGRPDLDRFCWLKGDPTFDTLWQACLAPERRASVSSMSPGSGQHGRINGATIVDTTWFTSGTVPINTGLVAIIGPRGSGKTALADLLAVGAGSIEPFANDASFVSRAGSLLTGQAATANWHEDTATTHSLVAPSDDSSSDPRRVRYLSQQFVERLCASDGVTSELLLEIERVIFDSWPVELRQGATSFEELLDIRLGAARARQREELDAITSIGEEITNERVLQRGFKRAKEEEAAATLAVTNVEAQIKDLTGKADTASGERHGEVSRALAKRQASLQSVDRKMTDLKKLQSATEAARSAQFPSIKQRLQQENSHAGLTEDAWRAFLPKFTGDVDQILTEALSVSDAEYKQIAGTPLPDGSTATLDGIAEGGLAIRTVAELTFEQKRLQLLVGLDTKRAAKLTQLQTQLMKARSAEAKLKEAVSAAKGAETRIQELIADRTARYEAYFNALLTEEVELKTLYAPLEEILNNYGPTVAKLKLSVQRRVNLDSWVDHAEKRLIDLRTTGPFRGTGGLRPIAETSLLRAWQSGDGKTASEAIQAFSAEFSPALRTHARADTKDNDAYREWEREISHWLYGVGHIRVVYSLEYDGLNVERLSPGSRGIVLLLLYLAVDISETDPLIIDQPEENLDPRSVYTELVKLFQTASDRRQIIMITHNANLVVNTDVDQVIVASCDGLEEGKLPRLSYKAGGLENPEIRKAVCEVLEGGAEAFRQRARRLHIDAPATRAI
jgi:energy-coupling factor transporter ATP-binding protein EcfA2